MEFKVKFSCIHMWPKVSWVPTPINFAPVVLPQISVASPQRVLLLYIKKLARLKHQKICQSSLIAPYSLSCHFIYLPSASLTYPLVAIIGALVSRDTLPAGRQQTMSLGRLPPVLPSNDVSAMPRGGFIRGKSSMLPLFQTHCCWEL